MDVDANYVADLTILARLAVKVRILLEVDFLNKRKQGSTAHRLSSALYDCATIQRVVKSSHQFIYHYLKMLIKITVFCLRNTRVENIYLTAYGNNND